MTATDWLRLRVREEKLNSKAKHAAQKALDSISAKPDESWLSATARLVSAFRTTRIDPDRPHASEATFFWRYVSEHVLKKLMERLVQLLERFGVVVITSLFVTEVSDTLPTSPVEPQCPMGYNMRMRGTATHEFFNRYATMMSARKLSNKRQNSPRTHVAAVNNQRISRYSSSDHVSEVTKLRYLLRDASESIYRPIRRDSPSPTDTTPKHPGVAPLRYAAAYQAASSSLAAIKNQAATTPGQHGLPFLHRRFGDDERNKRNNRDEACPSGAAPPPPYPAPIATRRDISSFIRASRVCFRYAFGIPCVPSTSCTYNHKLIPEGHYKNLPRAGRSSRAHETTPRPVGHTDILAPSAQSVNALAYLAGIQCDNDAESVGTPDTDTAQQE